MNILKLFGFGKNEKNEKKAEKEESGCYMVLSEDGTVLSVETIGELTKTEYSNRTEYTLNGKLHNTDGPALIWKVDTNDYCNSYPKPPQLYFENGILHRIGGPAIEGYSSKIYYHPSFSMVSFDGRQVYYKNGKRHNENGPAVILTSFKGGEHFYFYEGQNFDASTYFMLMEAIRILQKGEKK